MRKWKKWKKAGWFGCSTHWRRLSSSHHGTVEVPLHCSTAGQAEKAVSQHNQKPAQWLGLALKGVSKKLLNTSSTTSSTVVEWLSKSRASWEISLKSLDCQPFTAAACFYNYTWYCGSLMGKSTRVIEWLLKGSASGEISFRFLACQPLTAKACLILKYLSFYD